MIWRWNEQIHGYRSRSTVDYTLTKWWQCEKQQLRLNMKSEKAVTLAVELVFISFITVMQGAYTTSRIAWGVTKEEFSSNHDHIPFKLNLFQAAIESRFVRAESNWNKTSGLWTTHWAWERICEFKTRSISSWSAISKKRGIPRLSQSLQMKLRIESFIPASVTIREEF